MSAIKDTFFGGAEKDAAKAEIKQLQKAEQAVMDAIAKGEDLSKVLFGGAQETLQETYGKALDLVSGAIPERGRLGQEGNVAAQQLLINALPQMQNAILGRELDLSGLAPVRLTPDYSVLDVERPQFPDIATGLERAEVDRALENLPPEAGYIRGRLASGEIDYDTALNLLTTGRGYGKFKGIDPDLAAEFIKGRKPTETIRGRTPDIGGLLR